MLLSDVAFYRFMNRTGMRAYVMSAGSITELIRRLEDDPISYSLCQVSEVLLSKHYSISFYIQASLCFCLQRQSIKMMRYQVSMYPSKVYVNHFASVSSFHSQHRRVYSIEDFHRGSWVARSGNHDSLNFNFSWGRPQLS